MLKESKLKKNLEHIRLSHLVSSYAVALLMQLFTTIPHKQWILLTVLVVSAGIEPGLIMKRSLHRVKGTLFALSVLLPLLYFMQLNYRLVPIAFTLSLIGMVTSSLKPERYDISVFFITIVVFMLMTQLSNQHTPEGPFEMVLNRGICTLIGVAIVMIVDHSLFNTYSYSQKLYCYHQVMIYNLLKKTADNIIDAKTKKLNTIIFTEQLRTEFIKHFSLIETSSDNLISELKTNLEIKQQIKDYQKTIWNIRRQIFALNFSELLSPSTTLSKQHWQTYHELMSQAKTMFIKVHR